jgi:CHAT domain-containing protein/tetratricopeptide (TPR) repeat protein
MRRLVDYLAFPQAEAGATADLVMAQVGRDYALYYVKLMRETPEYGSLPLGPKLMDFELAVQKRAFGATHLSVAAVGQRIGRALAEMGEPRRAAERLEEVYAICWAQCGPRDEKTCMALIDLGNIRRELGELDLAEQHLTRALALLRNREPSDPLHAVPALGGLICLERERGYPDRARAFAREHLGLVRQFFGEAHPATAFAMLDLGAAELALDAQVEAQALFDQALVILRPRGAEPHPEAWAALHELGRLQMHRGWMGRALETLREAGRLARQAYGEHSANVFKTTLSLAELMMRSGPPVVARPLFSASLSLAIDAFGPRHPAVARTKTMLGRISMLLGDTARAQRELDESLAMLEERLDAAHPLIAEALEALAELDLREGRYAQALTRFERALTIRQARLGERHSSVAGALSGLARINSDLGRQEGALCQQEAALEILMAALGDMHIEVAEARSRLAAILTRAGEATTAAAQIWLAHTIRTKNLASAKGKSHADLAASLRDLGALMLSRGSLEEGRHHFVEAADLIRGAYGETHPDLVACYLGEASAHIRQGDAGEAERLLADALAILAAHPSPTEESQAYALLADLAEEASRPQAAIALGKLAVNALQHVRIGIRPLDRELQSGFLEGRADAYRALAARLISAGRLPEALQVRKMLKASELRESLRGVDEMGVAKHTAALNPEERGWADAGEAMRMELARLVVAAEQVGDGVPFEEEHQAQLRALTGERDGLKRKLATWFGEAEVEPRLPIAPLPDRKPGAVTGPGFAELDYIVQPRHVQVIVTTAAGQISRDIAMEEGELNALVFAFWSSLRQDAQGVLPVAQKLYTLLFAPIDVDLRQAAVRLLSLSLDGALRYVPFAALHDGGSYVVERYALSMRTGGGAPRTGEGVAEGRAAGFGTTREAPGLGALRFVKSELASVIKTPESRNGILPGVIRLDDAFTEAALREVLAGSAGIVHIASHFVFLPARDLDSWLLLGDGEHLTVERLLSSSFPFAGVDLLALSACETGMAARSKAQGREIETLPAMLRARGARAVLATLWPVDDASTATLMRAFYRAWHIDKLTRSEALRQAQLALLEDPARASQARGIADDEDEAAAAEGIASSTSSPPHPFHWAPFLLMDDPG